ncbi:cobalt transporter CbiM [Pleomorphomonas oryzae]|uniref:cobalt transporter CbiM n=1 Tax=Pleomorphomonas oryzae TaxID=261934 RepID=UPI00041FDC71|nr:cobalt transporter CbiM [Pleomorphomonas oryzae]
MHIPDGYLSPSTCAATFALAAPFWYVASRKVKRQLHTKLVPLMAVVSAFSFVVMMFNLPLPGGTTGHAVGLGIAAIVLGPWAAVLSISIALLIQAVFFGDGGITAIGANCFNMAIVGPFVAYAVYQAIAGRSELTSPRRVVAAGVAGYVGINAAALVAAIEFGLQPMLFHDAMGAPLYAPYPLSIALPAMLAGHLTIAGLAEAVAAAGLVAVLQRTEPELLDLTARRPATSGRWRETRALWFGLGLLMLLSPLGLVAAGTAWGEWGAADFADPAARQEIAAASGNVVPPEAVPSGLQRLSSVWSAPIPDYAPAFLRNEHLGYILSAVTGSGLVLLVFAGIGALRARRSPSV